jgi:hypothetical protein
MMFDYAEHDLTGTRADAIAAAAVYVKCSVDAVSKEAKYKGDIFMVFDYAEHDLTGMVDAVKTTTGLTPAQVSRMS